MVDAVSRTPSLMAMSIIHVNAQNDMRGISVKLTLTHVPITLVEEMVIIVGNFEVSLSYKICMIEIFVHCLILSLGECLNIKDVPNEFVCRCKERFQGQHCRYGNFCHSSPCRNGGSCIEIPKSFMCHCPTGFTGKRERSFTVFSYHALLMQVSTLTKK